ncbi:MAG: TonB-dependent receptor, partial [Bacteroidota bacterium]
MYFSTPSFMWRIAMWLIILCLYSGGVMASDDDPKVAAVSGRITDAQSGEPLVGATLRINEANILTHTDAWGGFMIEKLPWGVHEVIVNYLGYQDKAITIQIDDASPEAINVAMEPKLLTVKEVLIHASTGKLATIPSVNALDLQNRPMRSAQDALRMVPGLFTAQHAGGGKAEQIFLRGFDIDHGTDLAISVDGMPVNMVSHAHGQGYADLHFLIPETIGKVELGKGPYAANQGNFA